MEGETMASGLLEYSGLVTKTKAMHGRLLSRETIMELSECESVEDILGFLREYGSYAPIYRSHDEIAHRAQVEAVIDDSLYSDYGKLYRFSSGEQRKGLEILFLRYEMNVLKECLEYVHKRDGERNLAYLNLFFGQHASYDTTAVTEAKSMSELLQALAGTEYEGFLRRLVENEGMTHADYAIQLDILYYKMAWKRRGKLRNAKTRDIYTQILGTEIDWQNIMWMYRSKRFYDRKQSDIYADMIPITYLLKRKELKSMLESETIEEFVEQLGKTAYFTGKDALVSLGDEVTFRQMMEKTYQKMCRKYPMSIAPVIKYLYDKENEIETLTTILEGVRYRIPAREIQELVLVT